MTAANALVCAVNDLQFAAFLMIFFHFRWVEVQSTVAIHRHSRQTLSSIYTKDQTLGNSNVEMKNQWISLFSYFFCFLLFYHLGTNHRDWTKKKSEMLHHSPMSILCSNRCSKKKKELNLQIFIREKCQLFE